MWLQNFGIHFLVEVAVLKDTAHCHCASLRNKDVSERDSCAQVALVSRFWTMPFTLVWALSFSFCFPWLPILGWILEGLKTYSSSQARPGPAAAPRTIFANDD